MKRSHLAAAIAISLALGAAIFVLHQAGTLAPASSSSSSSPLREGTAADGGVPTAASSSISATALRGQNEVHAALSIDDPALRDTAVARALTAWVAQDAPAAAQFALHITAGPLRDLSVRTVSQAWGAADPKQASDWAKTLPAGERESQPANVCMGAAAQHPVESVEIADRITPRDDTLIENIIGQWTSRDITSAAAWVREEPPSEGRDRMTQRIALAQAHADPAAAANLILDQIPPGDEQTEAIITVVNQWARKNPQEAKAWVNQFPPGPVQQRAEQEIAAAKAH